MVNIDKNIPIPTDARDGRGLRDKYGIKKMEVGDSILFIENWFLAKNSIANYKMRHKGWNYITKAEGDGVRIWRTS